MKSPAQLEREYAAIVAELNVTYMSGVTRTYEWRMQQLGALGRMLQQHEAEWLCAVQDCFGKSKHEAYVTELLPSILELNDARSNLHRWMRPEKTGTPAVLLTASSWLEKQPMGTTLIIGPFNYPLMLLLGPLVGALAAGCPAVLKPSALSKPLSDLLLSLVPRYLDPAAIKVVVGDVLETQALLAQRWGNIIFTGSERVGKIVALAAAKHLTPCTLELGGKCPLIVGPRPGDLRHAARKIVWGRCVNGGQSCIAPEYLLVPKEMVDDLSVALVESMRHDYERQDMKQLSNMARVVTTQSAKRIADLLAAPHGGTVLCGGKVDVEGCYVEPTLILDPAPDSALMNEEIFGPVLCIISTSSLDEAIAYAAAKPTPLSLYVFSGCQQTTDKVMRCLPSGSACINDVLIHFANPCLPFGGLGPSGMGKQHGKAYFDACSSSRAVMSKGTSWLTKLLDIQVILRSVPNSPWKIAIGRVYVPIAFNLPANYGYKVGAAVLAMCAWSYCRGNGYL